jgi:hypothetical protein
MMRRILVGAAIVGAVFGFSATGASADVGPNPYNGNQQILSQFSIADKLWLLNGSLNDSLKYIDVITLLHLNDIDINALSDLGRVGDNN